MGSKFWIILTIAIIVVVIVIIVYFKYFITQNNFPVNHSCTPSLVNPQCSANLWCSGNKCVQMLSPGDACDFTQSETGCENGCDSSTSECLNPVKNLIADNSQQIDNLCAVNGNNCEAGLYCSVINTSVKTIGPKLVSSSNGYSTVSPTGQAPTCIAYSDPGSVCNTPSNNTESNCQYGCEPQTNTCLNAPISIEADKSGQYGSVCAINGNNCSDGFYCVVQGSLTQGGNIVTSSNGYQTVTSSGFESVCLPATLPGGPCMTATSLSEDSCVNGCDAISNTCLNPIITVNPNNSEPVDSACIVGNNNCQTGLYCTLMPNIVAGPSGPTEIVSSNGITSVTIPAGYLTTCQPYSNSGSACNSISSTTESNCQNGCDLKTDTCLGQNIIVNTVSGKNGDVCVPSGQNCDSSYFCQIADGGGLPYSSLYISSNNNQSIIVPQNQVYSCIPKLTAGDVCDSDEECPDRCIDFGSNIGKRCTQYDVTVETQSQQLYEPCAISGNNCISSLYCASVDTNTTMSYNVVSKNGKESYNENGNSTICMNPLSVGSICDSTSTELNQCNGSLCVNNVCQAYTEVDLSDTQTGQLYDNCVINGNVCSDGFYCTSVQSSDSTLRKFVSSNGSYAYLLPNQSMACEQKIESGGSCVEASSLSEESCSNSVCTNLVCT